MLHGAAELPHEAIEEVGLADDKQLAAAIQHHAFRLWDVGIKAATSPQAAAVGGQPTPAAHPTTPAAHPTAGYAAREAVTLWKAQFGSE